MSIHFTKVYGFFSVLKTIIYTITVSGVIAFFNIDNYSEMYICSN